MSHGPWNMLEGWGTCRLLRPRLNEDTCWLHGSHPPELKVPSVSSTGGFFLCATETSVLRNGSEQFGEIKVVGVPLTPRPMN